MTDIVIANPIPTTRYIIQLHDDEKTFAAAFVRTVTLYTAEEATRAAVRLFSTPREIAKCVVDHLNEYLLGQPATVQWRTRDEDCLLVLSDAFSSAFWTNGMHGSVTVL